MVKSIKDEGGQPNHPKYDEWFRWQYIADLDIGDEVEIKIVPIDGGPEIEKKFVATYKNCHINCQWQDKGDKNIED